MKDPKREKEQLDERRGHLYEELGHMLFSTSVVIYISKAFGDYGTTFISDNIRDMTGYGPEEFTANSVFWTEHVHFDDVQRVLNELENVVKDKTTHIHEYRFRRKDEGYIWIRDEMRIIRDKDGSPLEIIGCRVNITEYKEIEEELKRSEEKFKMIFHNTYRGVVITDGKTKKFSFCNERFSKMLGYSAAEIGTMGIMDIHPPEDLPHVLREFDRLLNNKIAETRDIRVKRKDGSVFYADIGASGVEFWGKKYVLGFFMDAAERRHLESALRESEKWFKDIMEISSDWIWEIDDQGKYVYVSNSIKSILGYEADEILGKTPFDLMPRDEAVRIKPIFDKIVLEKKPIKHLENWNLTKDGRKVCVVTNGVPILSEKGQLLGYRGIDKDITERMEKLTDLEVFKRFSDDAGQGFGMATLDGFITYANSALLRIFEEKKPGDIIGKSIMDFYPKEYVSYMKEHVLPIAFSKGEWRGESTIVSVGGKITHVIENIFVIRDEKGEPISFANIVTDITERKESEKALQESEKKYRLLAENIEDVVWTTDVGMCFTYFSPSVKEVLGYDPKEMLGKNAQCVLSPSSFVAAANAFKKNLEMEVPPRNVSPGPLRLELEHLRKDGSLVWCEVQITFLRDEEGKPKGILGVTRDIAKRKDLEKEKEKQLRELEIFFQASKNREERILELKKKVEDLEKELKNT